MASMKVIYADSLVLLNFTIDYLLILAAGKICALPLRRRRMALGALFGGAYALLAALVPGLFGLAAAKIAAGLASAAIAFYGLGPFPRTAIVFFAVAAAFGGAVYAVTSLGGSGAAALSPKTLILSFALCYGALSLVFRGSARPTNRETAQTELSLRGRRLSLTALRDTGNALRDSLGCPIMAAEWAALAPLFPELPPGQDLDPPGLLLALSALPGMESRCRLFPCLTATDTSGLLPAFRPDGIRINGQSAPHRYVAIISGPLSPTGDYRALF